MQPQAGKIDRSVDDDRRRYLHSFGQKNDGDAAVLPALVRVLQRPEVRTALRLRE